jgi:hypothetical protein
VLDVLLNLPWLQATGFLTFISVRMLLAGRTVVLTVAPVMGGLLRKVRRRQY